MLEHTHEISEIRWLPCLNSSGEVIPAYAVMQIASVGTQNDGTVLYTVIKPDTDHALHVLFNGPTPLAVGGYGVATCDFPAVALYDTTLSAGSPPDPGESWGVQDGSWYLQYGYRGFVGIGFLDGLNSIGSSGRGGVFIREPTTNFSGVKTYGTGTLVPTGGTGTQLVNPLGTVIYDTDNYTSGLGGFTIPQDGYYEVGTALMWQFNATGIRELGIVRAASGGGSSLIGYILSPSTATGPTWGPSQQVIVSVRLNDGDGISFYGRQTSGGLLSVTAASFTQFGVSGTPFGCWVTRIGT